MRIDDAGEHRKQFAYEIQILGGFKVLARGLEKPQSGVDGIVLRGAAVVGKVIGNHAAIDISGGRTENFASDVWAAEGECEARQSDHGVAAPIGEPVIAGKNGAAIGIFGGGAFHDELIGGEN